MKNLFLSLSLTFFLFGCTKKIPEESLIELSQKISYDLNLKFDKKFKYSLFLKEIKKEIKEQKLDKDSDKLDLIISRINSIPKSNIKDSHRVSELEGLIDYLFSYGEGNCFSYSILYLSLAKNLGIELKPVMIPGHIYLRHNDRNIETTVSGKNLDNKNIASLLYLKPESLDFKETSNKRLLAGLFSNACIIASKLAKFKKAIEYCNKAIEIDSTVGEAYINRSYVYGKIGDFNSALKDAQKGVEIYPNSSHAFLTLGIALKKSRQVNDAMKAYLKSIELRPNLFRSYFNIGNIYLDQSNYHKAVEYYNKTAEIKRDYHHLYINRAIAFNKLGNKIKALKDFNYVLKLNGPNFDITYEKGLLYYQLKKYKLSKKEFLSLKKDFPLKFKENNVENIIAELDSLIYKEKIQ